MAKTDFETFAAVAIWVLLGILTLIALIALVGCKTSPDSAHFEFDAVEVNVIRVDGSRLDWRDGALAPEGAKARYRAKPGSPCEAGGNR